MTKTKEGDARNQSFFQARGFLKLSRLQLSKAGISERVLKTKGLF
ncbi:MULTISPECIES: hypothetical protein [unclassified Prochlorococcus]|nr:MULTISPECIES: hypothetical protein [unclassified Prochlorococcus]KGG25817.1 hypothetical protein EV12_1958 [Prochlorococcus sp. MIT 0701]KGG26861.1 hypothetical protein EV13_2322 [Prochlorococcus sp. MIT 0702]KGG36137.1 hypothetical protein EV14_0546 [Prochlorococcus sp. MIT 0703]